MAEDLAKQLRDIAVNGDSLFSRRYSRTLERGVPLLKVDRALRVSGRSRTDLPSSREAGQIVKQKSHRPRHLIETRGHREKPAASLSRFSTSDASRSRRSSHDKLKKRHEAVRTASSLSDAACKAQSSSAGSSGAQPVTRSARETRRLALALQDCPVPELTKKDVEHRWQAAPDRVRKILRLNGVDPGGRKSLLIPLIDLLACGGISDPLKTWIFSSEDERKILSAGLLTLSDVGALPGSPASLHPDTFFRHIADGRLPSIRIGNRHRFRRDMAAAESWLEKGGGGKRGFVPSCQQS